MLADDTGLAGGSTEKCNRLMSEVYERNELKVNMEKNNVKECNPSVRHESCGGIPTKELKEFIYLPSLARWKCR